MHVQIINFRLKDITGEEFREHAEAVAPKFAEMPGLVSKTWLANPETNTYGGMYVWRDQEAMEDYKRTDIYNGIMTNPHFEEAVSKEFAVLEDPTRITRGLNEAEGQKA